MIFNIKLFIVPVAHMPQVKQGILSSRYLRQVKQVTL